MIYRVFKKQIILLGLVFDTTVALKNDSVIESGVFQRVHLQSVFPLGHVVADAALELRLHAALEPLVIIQGRRMLVAFAALFALITQQVV